MKYLSNYTQDKQTALFKECGAFFAFSQKQLDYAKLPDVKYASLGSGLICPVTNIKKLAKRLFMIQKEGIAQDIEENGKDAIIQRELGNHECQITGDVDVVVKALEDYGITELEVQEGYREFYQMCVNNHLF